MDVASSVQQARQWVAEGQFEPALEMLQSLKRQMELEPSSLAPVQQLEVWRGLLTVAQCRCDAGLAQEAVPKMLQVGRELYEFDSPLMGSLLHHAGQALAASGAGGEAETFFTQALRRLPADPATRSRYARGLAFFYALYGHLEFALRWAEEAGAHVRELSPEEQLTTIRTVGALMDALGKHLEAQALRNQVLEQLAPEQQAWLLLDQARSQRRLGWAGKAEALYRQALPHLPAGERPRIYRELALTLLSKRDLAGTGAVLEEGLSQADPVSFEAQLLRAEQGRLWQFEGRFADSERVLTEVLASWEERFQPHHPLCLRLREALIELCILRRDFLTGLQRAQTLLQIVAERYTSEHPGVARALYWMAQVWGYQGQREYARQALVQAEFIWDGWEDLWELERAQILYGLGLIMAEELEFYRAEEYIRKACDMVEQGMSPNSVALGHFLAGLADVHRITGRDRQSQEAAQRSQELIRPRR